MKALLFGAAAMSVLLSTAAAAQDQPQAQAQPPAAVDKAAKSDPAASQAPVEAGVTDLTRVHAGYTYFNKPGADLDAHNADLKYCASIAPLATQPRELEPSAGGLLGALINAEIVKMEVRRGIAANTENCMVVRGWRVVQVPDAEGEGLAKLDQASLSEQLKTWVGADPPHGQIVRAWDNDAAKSKTEKFRDAGPVEHPSLSLTALAKDLDAPLARPAEGPRPPKSARMPRRLKPDQLAGLHLGPDEALVIVRIKHPGFHNGLGVEIERVGPDPETPAWYADQKPFVFTAGAGLLFAKGDGSDYAYVVPAGTWRLDGMLEAFSSVGFCLGAPTFELKGGDVVYAGAFDLGADDIGPDLAPDPAKAFLAGSQELQAKLLPAAWTNGATSICRGAYFYAYEIKGAPSHADYVRGQAPVPKAAKASSAPSVPSASAASEPK